MNLLIKYEDSDGNLTERQISDIEIEPPNAISAYCHLRKARRIFMLRRISFAKDLNTNNKIRNIYTYFSLPVEKYKKVKDEEYGPIVTRRVQDLSIQQYKEERKKEKDFLFKRFYYPVVIEFYKKKLFELFNNKCFKCRSEKILDIDHHIPMKLGGHLVPGNLVILCKKCNNKKRDSPPSKFYSKEELSKLEPMLLKQNELFKFKFDRKSWDRDRKAYLIRLGIDEKIASQISNEGD